MPNAWNHPSLIATEALSQMTDNLTWGRLTTRDTTGKFVGNEMKIGDTVNLRSTPDYEAKEFVNDGTNTIEKQEIRSALLPFTIDKIFDVSVEITSREKALDLDSFTTEVIAPAAQRLAEKVDAYIASKAYIYGNNIYASANLLGTVADLALARKQGNYQQLNKDRFIMCNSDLEAKLLGLDYFYSASIRGDGANQAALAEGFLARTMSFNFYGEQSNYSEGLAATTFGNLAATTDNTGGANKIGSYTLKVDGATGDIASYVDRIQVAGMRRPLIVAEVVNATTLRLLHPIMELVPDNAAITTVYTTKACTFQGIMMDSRAMGLAMPPLGAPSDKPSFVISNNGYSIRVVQGYDMDKKVETMSLDTMVGAGPLDPRRITILADYP